MERILDQFANNYSERVNQKFADIQDKRDAFNPVIFVFLGDKIRDCVYNIKNTINGHWSNSNGIVYLNICTNNDCIDEKVFNIKLSYNSDDQKTLRQNIYDDFLKDENTLIELNNVISRMKNSVLEQDLQFESFNRVNLSFVTSVNDPLNVLLIPVALLIKDKLQTVFPSIHTDLYELIEEKNNDVEDGYQKAVSMSFFKEIEYAQTENFNFCMDINIQKGGAKYPVTNNISPVFDIVYMLSDRNGKGFYLEDPLARNSEIISFICLLKNGNKNNDVERYDDGDFIINIKAVGKQTYASAGLAKLKRPNRAIAFSIMKAFSEALIKISKEISDKANKDLKKLFLFDDQSLELKLEKIIPSKDKISSMVGIMQKNEKVSTSYIKKMILKEFESYIYENCCNNFFKRNFIEVSNKRLQTDSDEEKISRLIIDEIAKSSYDLYNVFEWTKDENVISIIEESIKNNEKVIKQHEDKLNSVYGRRVKLPFYYILPWFRTKTIYTAKKQLFEQVYSVRYELLKLEIRNKLLKSYKEGIRETHQTLKTYVEDIDRVLTGIRTYNDRELYNTNDYVGGNIDSFYTLEVNKAIEKLGNSDKEKISKIFSYIKDGKEAFYNSLIQSCSEFVFRDDKFSKPFEEEIHLRANSSVLPGKDDVITWEELYNKIYLTLESNSEVNINIMNFMMNKIHEEKYLYGNSSSNFIKNAFKYHSMVNDHKLGCVNEKNSKGIEELKIIGGFNLESLTCYDEMLRSYKYYVEKGYKLHGTMSFNNYVQND